MTLRSVFVYGTLMPVEGRYTYLDGITAARPAELHGWQLHGAHHPYPWIKPAQRDAVTQGYVLTFARDRWDENLLILDLIEGVPHLFHRRVVWPTVDGNEVEAWAFTPSPSFRVPYDPIESGSWTAHQEHRRSTTDAALREASAPESAN